MVGSGVLLVGFKLLVAEATGSITRTNLLGDAGNQAEHHVSITGPVNILLVGIDTRPQFGPSDLSRSDSIIVVHVPASHDVDEKTTSIHRGYTRNGQLATLA